MKSRYIMIMIKIAVIKKEKSTPNPTGIYIFSTLYNKLML